MFLCNIKARWWNVSGYNKWLGVFFTVFITRIYNGGRFSLSLHLCHILQSFSVGYIYILIEPELMGDT